MQIINENLVIPNFSHPALHFLVQFQYNNLKGSIHLLFLTALSVVSRRALALVGWHGADSSVLAVGGARAVAAVRAAEPVRTRTHIVPDANPAVRANRVTRNWRKER